MTFEFVNKHARKGKYYQCVSLDCNHSSDFEAQINQIPDVNRNKILGSMHILIPTRYITIPSHKRFMDNTTTAICPLSMLFYVISLFELYMYIYCKI